MLESRNTESENSSFRFECITMDDSSYRLNFDLGKKNKIHHHS